MSAVIVVTSPEPARSESVVRREESLIARAGGRVLVGVRHATVASGTEAIAAELRKQGYQVALHPDADRLRIAGLDIDINNPRAAVDANESVPDAERSSWPLHVAQFAGPPFPEWVAEVERLGARQVDRAGKYGLYLYADPAVAQQLSRLPFVTAVSPLEPAWKIDPRLRREPAGDPGQIDLAVFPSDAVQSVSDAVVAVGGRLVRVETAPPGQKDRGAHVVVAVATARALELAKLPNVRAVSWLPPVHVEGERETQIQAENLDGTAAPNTGPVTGYVAFLTGIGADGTGVTVSIVDSGVDVGANNNATGHQDLRGRQVAFFDYNGVPTDQNGHGTHVAGIAIGNGATGLTEAAAPADFLWGEGSAPGASFVGQSVADPANPAGSGLSIPAVGTLTSDAVTSGASVQNNSWSGAGSPNAYAAREAAYDMLVRDADAGTAAREPMAIVFAASNDGGLPATLGDPSGAKNLVTVGNSLTRRVGTGLASDDIRGMKGSSSRGPASGGRIKPDVVSPGTDVSSARSSACNRPAIANTNNQYVSLTGTSMSAPNVTGAIAVLIDWWRDRTGGATPSPAMLKALLINGAEDLAGGPNWRAIAFNRIQQGPDRYRSAALTFVPGQVMAGNTVLNQVAAAANLANLTWFFDAATNQVTVQATFNNSPLNVKIDLLNGVVGAIPNNDQGWGRVSLRNVVSQPPDSDRGPCLYIDQRHAFTTSGQSHTWRVQPVDPARPMRVTLVWTDAPGVANDATPLVNNLNLELRDALMPPTIWHGNPANFVNGFSTPGGVADSSNNVEGVYVQAPAGIYEVIVRGTTITEDARNPGSGTPWQDYALVLENAVYASAAPVSVSVLIDRSGSMVSAGYVDVTRATSKLFVDLLQPNDRVGVVSFSDNATDVYSDAGLVDLIDGPAVNVAARNAIDAIPFGGCTFMGQGLQTAEAQLAGAPGNRAIVLLSDGFDNKGCQPQNAARPWAVDVAAGLPAGIDVYTCAMGPASDQAKLEQIAALTGGQYYFMPTIDDLHETYNYIRGNVSGDAVIVNATSSASSSNVPAYVDCGAEQVVFACQWHAPGMHWVGRAPKKPSEIFVYLVTPDGKAVPSKATWVNRRTGENYVIFTIDDPRPGRWRVAVETSGNTHTQYTVGGWLRSQLQLVVGVDRVGGGAGTMLAHIGLQSQIGRALDVRYTASISRPPATLAALLKKHKTLIDNATPDPKSVKDGIDDRLARAIAADQSLRATGKPSIFAPVVSRLDVTQRVSPVIPQPLLPRPVGGMINFAPGALVTPGTHPALQRTSTHQARTAAGVAGSYALRVVAAGTDPVSRCRFERYVMRCFIVA
jgi:Mg-chelatase subunit ChlD